MNLHRSSIEQGPFSKRDVTTSSPSVLNEQSFYKMVSIERKRTERSGTPFLLMLLDLSNCLKFDQNGETLRGVLAALAQSLRETDVIGWYEEDSTLGVMFTEINLEDRNTVLDLMLERMSEVLQGNLSAEHFSQVNISFHIYPEDWTGKTLKRANNPALYPDLAKRDNDRRASRVVKRMLDIAGSALALVVGAPVFFIIAATIKLTSPGPVFFRQQRVGEHGASFTFLKFRSMYVNNDASAHKAYVRKLIAGQAEQKPGSGSQGAYKLTNDPRITRIGAFLRKTSLDELPQFFNVLRGEMSLVGPRPAIPYEVEAYDTWHRRRVLEAKPGITGLWQVNGRSRVKFDDMVRLDLRYAKTWSVWMDIKILLVTPFEVLLGDGAY